MKLVIQIPCLNEAAVLADTLAQLPRKVRGFQAVEWLVVDDGSSDGTGEVARRCGVDHVVRNTHRRGLAFAFSRGLDTSLALGADVIVNFDADNQYRADDIPKLTDLILRGEADIVIGARPLGTIESFSATKKWLQHTGSRVVRLLSTTQVPDATSGFRAISRDAAMQLSTFSRYTYTLETIIQAGHQNLAVRSVPIGVNPVTRPSRLVRGNFSYVRRSANTILRTLIVYRPFLFFTTIAGALLFLGLLLGLVHALASATADGHLETAVIAVALCALGVQALLLAFSSAQHSANRKLLEEIRYRLQRSANPDGHE